MITLRAPAEEDFPAIEELFAAGTELYEDVAPDPDGLRLWLTSPTVDLERDIRLAFDDERLVGYGDVDPRGEDPVRWWCEVRVHPEADIATVTDALLAWLELRAGDGLLRCWVPVNLEPQRRAYEARGLRRVRSSYRMLIDLDDALPAPEFPEGIDVRTLATGDEHVAYAVHQESFDDTWEYTREPYEEWAHYVFDPEVHDPSLFFIAWEGDDAAAVAMCRLRAGMGWVDVLGVRRRWRRRGLGRALLLHAFAEFRRRGFAQAGLGVDAESLTGAHRLYESVGMRVARQLEFYEKPLPSER